jgi:hypothetical protein
MKGVVMLGMSGDITEFAQAFISIHEDFTVADVLELDFYDVIHEFPTRLIENEITDEGRWTIYKRAVVDYGGKLFAVSYGVGATEMQENDEDFYIKRVYPKSVTKIIYE